ncbi:tRNA methyltransferase PPM2 [Aspergillus saccharolyticus JOP 1030-1]|uniref:tRNA wybutosine-synthesizing protein 4 n=1 Tax=Aspergillus saccharolyticus JOP 1030-1 TaxID=1450539 RepID=A0A318ZB51_9EURO|nr:leucine carboxyl methyltransferase [Aspergillus saccharolyticus JOP 1030-1]PYH44529.1 leucine carboxyl methyltransferase [Aspergillus saccharolyticus JOP 1030-1]
MTAKKDTGPLKASGKKPVMAPAITKAEKEADLVMGTNNSSIVSKRSVEMLYYPKPHYFRYFVKKPQRRSPLINRGYWLRMHAMAETVRKFMAEPSGKPKFVLNLGCGFDPLPFILLNTEKPLCKDTRFVDIDYEKLMINKKTAIRRTEEITQLLENVEFLSDESAIQIQSEHYIAIGCDLKNLKKLDDVLRREILPADCSVLFLAEVSLTYMDVKSANEVLKWAAQMNNDARFCILEQFFPDGPDHPFASTMMKHFKKLGAPLYSIHEFPSLNEQEQRFKKAGWQHAHARSLWDIWSDDDFVSRSLRCSLDEVEPFDEWEEFALFSSHYFLLIASTKDEFLAPTTGRSEPSASPVDVSNEFELVHTSGLGQRRFGALVPDEDNTIGYHAGLGRQTRLATTDLYSRSEEAVKPHWSFPPRDISARMCHTITHLSGSDCLLVGGRASPAAGFGDCWVRQGDQWRPTASLPTARFRHSATRVTFDSDHVVVYGGKSSDGATLDSWLVWSNADGWLPVEISGGNPGARFGACLANIDNTSGVLFGGMSDDGVIVEDFWVWTLLRRGEKSFCLDVQDRTKDLRALSPLSTSLSRFGATTSQTSRGLVIGGGIIPRQIVPAQQELLLLNLAELATQLRSESPSLSPSILSSIGLGKGSGAPRPLLVGHASHAVDRDEVLFLGGGAVCFSFGTFWSEGTWILKQVDSSIGNNWTLIPEPVSPPQVAGAPTCSPNFSSDTTTAKEVTLIPRVQVQTAAQFQQILAEGKPVIIEGSDLGPCTSLWTKAYLEQAVGRERKVVVHEAQSEHMSFQTKNFSYTTKEFGTFLDEVHAGGRQYLRSISADQPAKLPANLAVDFPGLGDDFRLPEAFSVVTENAHSSPLRISGPVTLWLHYDVMANILCQIRGDKRLILYPPSDVQYLHVPAGASSSNLNIFKTSSANHPDPGTETTITHIPHTSPHEARLRAGDILFLPPLWLHTASPTQNQVSVAVNVFFRNLRAGYAAGRDVYGNRDLQAYEKGRGDVQKIAKAFEGVPGEMARFYLLRLGRELMDLAGA